MWTTDVQDVRNPESALVLARACADGIERACADVVRPAAVGAAPPLQPASTATAAAQTATRAYRPIVDGTTKS